MRSMELAASKERNPIMPTLTRPVVDFSHASELLEVARTIVQGHRDQDLIEKVTLLQGYLDSSQMQPDQDYGPVVRKAITELTAAVHSHFRSPDVARDGQEISESNFRVGDRVKI